MVAGGMTGGMSSGGLDLAIRIRAAFVSGDLKALDLGGPQGGVAPGPDPNNPESSGSAPGFSKIGVRALREYLSWDECAYLKGRA